MNKKTLFLIIIFLIVGVYIAHAQEVAKQGNASDIKTSAENMSKLILTIIQYVGAGAAAVMVGIVGVTYMTKPSSERGEEDARKLKASIIKIAIGGGLVIAASTIGKIFIGTT